MAIDCEGKPIRDCPSCGRAMCYSGDDDRSHAMDACPACDPEELLPEALQFGEIHRSVDMPWCCGCRTHVAEVCYNCGYCEDCCACPEGTWEGEDDEDRSFDR